jgi:FtsP/CotA-like multicopper oxidase with cupredoxin domain
MVVNGVIWPSEAVEPRNYRLHLLNGTDSRFMAVRFREVAAGANTISDSDPKVPFWVVGSDQGLAAEATEITDFLLSEPGSRYDIVVDFGGKEGKRVIMENIAGDAPFGGDLFDPLVLGPGGIDDAVEAGDLFVARQTDRIMAFDVVLPLSGVSDIFDGSSFSTDYQGVEDEVDRMRKVALFEGMDEFGRLQPLLGTAEPATDFEDNAIPWPVDDPNYDPDNADAGMQGSIAWHSPTTENPALGEIEEWEIWNGTGDAHPVHLHLVHFQVLDRFDIFWDSNVDDDGFIPNGVDPAGDGTYMEEQPVMQHNGETGIGFRFVNPTKSAAALPQPDGYVENTPKDMVTALPGQVTCIRAKFDKPGRYVWHCHILSHEDHEMMRVLHVGPIPPDAPAG